MFTSLGPFSCEMLRGQHVPVSEAQGLRPASPPTLRPDLHISIFSQEKRRERSSSTLMGFAVEGVNALL